MITVGIATAYGVNVAFSGVLHGWRFCLGLSLLPALLLFVGMFLLPETPRWLCMQDRFTEAETVIAETMPGADQAAVVYEIRGELRDPLSLRWSDLCSRTVRRPLLVGVLLPALQQMTGINVFVYYSPMIFATVRPLPCLGSCALARTEASLQVNEGTHMSALIMTLIMGGVNVLLTLVALALVDRVGRRALLLSGVVGMALAWIALAAFFIADAPHRLDGACTLGFLSVQQYR
jgi:major inositol transporter-like SP family MFS transporter